MTIGKVVRDWRRVLPEAVIYVYDNNSTDGTAACAKEAGAIVRQETMQGKGNVIRRMFREINAECYIMVDGDDTYSAEAGPQMAAEVLEHQCDMVIGDRLSSTYFTENHRPFHNFGNRLTRTAINRLFRTDIRDIMTGLRAFSFNFVKTFPVLSKGFEIETEMTIHAVDKNMCVRNIVIDYRDRPEGSVSKLNTLSDGIRVLITIFDLFRNCRPFLFFGGFSLFLLISGLLFFIPVLTEFLRTGLVPRFPTLIISVFLMLAALISFFSGLILDSIKRQEKQTFEFRLHTIQLMKVGLSTGRKEGN